MSNFDVYFLDVGQGDCSLICPPEGNPILMDCSSAYVALRVLNDLNISHLEAIVVSHLDKDHIAGILPFMKQFINDGGIIEKIFIDMDRHKNDITDEASALLKECLRWHEQSQIEIEGSRRGSSSVQIVPRTQHWSVEIVSPSQYQHLKHGQRSSSNPNALSVVIRIQCFGRSILIGADAPLSAWEHVENAYLPADIFRIPHHGANIEDKRNRWSSMREFYQEVSPSLAVVSVGTRNGHDHPTEAHVHALPGSCRKLCTQLTKQCHDDPIDARTEALTNIRRTAEILPYRHDEKPDEVPCAGSIMVTISPDGLVETFPPANDWHDKFITHVPRAMCRA